MKSLLLTLGIACLAGWAVGVDQHGERCTVTQGNGIMVDSCDGSKLLTCVSGRCSCDGPDQIYDFKLVKKENSRSKRSPKRGKGIKNAAKTVAIGAGAAAAGGYIGYQAGKHANGGDSDSSGGSYGYGRTRKEKYDKVYSCYSRIGGQCALDLNNVNIVALPPSDPIPPVAAPTEVTNTTTGTENANGTESSVTIPATTVAPAVLDFSKMPKCVQNAVCKPKQRSLDNSTHIIKTESDPRLGACECEEGYKRTNLDTCVKDKSSGAHSAGMNCYYIALVCAIILSFR